MVRSQFLKARLIEKNLTYANIYLSFSNCKAYLQSKGVTAPMTTAGRGPADPVVQCEGSKPTPQLTACLQPNRRVEITIVGVTK
jgi:hypothetical protein